MIEDKYKKAFLEEAFELIENTVQLVLQLEKNPSNELIINELFRYMHSLKSEAGLLGFNVIMELSHLLEDIFDFFRKTKKKVSKNIITEVLRAIDFIQESVNSISASSEEIANNTSNEIIKRLNNIKDDLSNSADLSNKKNKEEKIEQNNLEINNIKNSSQDISSEDLTIKIKEDIDLENIKKIFSLNEFEIQLIQSEEANYLYVTVVPMDSCIMKYPRIYLVYNNLKQISEIIKTNPIIDEDQDDNHYSKSYFLVKTNIDINSEEFLSSFKVDEISLVIIQKVTVPQKIQMEEEKGVENSDEDFSVVKKTSSNTLRIDIDKLDSLGRAVGELITNRAKFEKILEYVRSGESLNFIGQKLEESSAELFRISDELQTIIMQLRMIPVNIIFNKFPRVVRDIASKLGKEVDFFINGGNTEIDKKVIEEIQDPITHLIRNAIDHGIESKEERIAKGKAPKGRITLAAYQEGSHIIIEVSDDGGGINYEKIAKKVKRLYPDVNVESLTHNELLDYLFKPGFTTKDEVTTLSGRGVGLDVVKEHVSRLRGRIDVTSEKDIGTSIKIILPLTLTILEVLMVKAQDSFYAIPIYNIELTDRIPINSIEKLDNYDILQYRNEVYSVIYLSELVGKGKTIKTEDDLVYIVIVRYNRRKICILIDDLIGEQDVVVQSLDEVFKRIKGVSGVAILGDGSVALILDIPEIVRDFVNKNSTLIDKIDNNSSLAKVHDQIVKNFQDQENKNLKIEENKISENKIQSISNNIKDFVNNVAVNNNNSVKEEKEITELSISDLS